VKLSCDGCGARLSMSHSFCPKCGVRINEAT
jgi:rRNA maturation endonuclease Nob1